MLLLRQHISQRLRDYYSQPSNAVVGKPFQTVNFRNLLGEWHWRNVYRKLYNEQHGQWLTPVELFSPFYSQVFAEYCIQQQQQQRMALSSSSSSSSEEFEIIELGGGRGTNAMGILQHIQQTQPDIYRRLSQYTIIDSSPTLHQLQQELLLQSPHASKMNFIQRDLTDVAESQTTTIETATTTSSTTSSTTTPLLQSEPSDIPTIFIALELLDNLGHDKIQRSKRTLQQAILTPHRSTSQDCDTDHDDGARYKYQEVFVPLSDPLLEQIIHHVPDYCGGSSGEMTIPIWIPSVACGLLSQIVSTRPNSSLVVADFDFLPPPDLEPPHLQRRHKQRQSFEAQGEPIVTDMNRLDHECYLNAPHLVDILFPTDFGKLAQFASKVFPPPTHTVKVWKQADFLNSVGPAQVQATRGRWTGYSPMVQDFCNCSVMTVSQGQLK